MQCMCGMHRLYQPSFALGVSGVVGFGVCTALFSGWLLSGTDRRQRSNNRRLMGTVVLSSNSVGEQSTNLNGGQPSCDGKQQAWCGVNWGFA
jgi:hypothetical protein